MPESRRYSGDVGRIECGVWNIEYRGLQHRDKDLASTYVLYPCWRTRLSLILEETSRGDTRGLYCQEGEQQEGTGD